ncbi:MAG: SdrD B-like domain-containing protein [Acidobacteriota bacterium]
MRLTNRILLAGTVLALVAAPRLLAAPAQGTISGVVFHDLNANGLQDGSEVGLANWTVTATQGGTTDSATTDALGNFLITNVTSGTWTVQVVPPVGWVPTTPESVPVLVGTSGNSLAGSFGFALLPEAPALDGAGATILALLLFGGALVVLRRFPRRRRD